jgi:hypothetical protein
MFNRPPAHENPDSPQILFDFAVEPSIAVHVNLASGIEFTAPQDVFVRG